MSYVVITYIMYVTLSIGLTVWVANTLFKNGRVFLIDIFHGNHDLADSVNKLLVVGFYLLNFGYALYALKVYGNIDTMRHSIEALSMKIGVIVFVLGIFHFFNLFLLFKLRKRAKDTTEPRVAFPKMDLTKSEIPPEALLG